MRSPKRILFTFVLLAIVSIAAAAHAQDPNLSTAVSAGGWITICPAGDGETLAGAGATITITLLDGDNNPVVGYPKEDIWIQSAVPGELVFCSLGSIADFDTDEFGVTTISGTFRGGGCTRDGLQVVVGGVPLAGPPLDIDVNSPDINGDLQVNLCDLILFSPAYLGQYAFCSDFTKDLVVNLADLSYFAMHYCHECPGGMPPPSFTKSGEIGVFFDPAGTQTGSYGIVNGIPFQFYVVALSAPGDILAYQFGLTVDPNAVIILNQTVMPAGSIDLSGSDTDALVATVGGCMQVTGPTVLAQYQALLLYTATDSPICLTAPQTSCDYPPIGPSYLTCLGDCDWREFYPAYQGCAMINGNGPVATESTTWGQLKALYRN